MGKNIVFNRQEVARVGLIILEQKLQNHAPESLDKAMGKLLAWVQVGVLL